MRKVNKSDAPALTRNDGLVSHILHSQHEVSETDLTITWVDVEPGARQVRHEHNPEQVYVILSGTGIMTVGDDERTVAAGDLVHIPSNTEHSLENTGDRPLEYVSAATPSFPAAEVDEFYEQ